MPLADDDSLQLAFGFGDDEAAVSAGVSAPPVAEPATFVHPRANREALLGGSRIGYEFRRARRKTIGFVVASDGLVVSAPRWVTLGAVDEALQERSRWILRKLRDQDDRVRRVQAQRLDWRDGMSIPFLGEPVTVRLDPTITGARLHAPAHQPAHPADDAVGEPASTQTLHLGLPPHAERGQIRDAVQSWLQREARRIFDERCRHFADRLGVKVRRVSLSSATTRWGSANATGAIRLHWRLVHFGLPIIDYVVAHELAHLREMNHSAAFWDLVRSVVPDVDAARGALREDVLPAFD